jgi:hypothetical protein
MFLYHRRLLTAVGMSINLLLVSNAIFRRQPSSTSTEEEFSFLDPSEWDMRRDRHHRIVQRRHKNEVDDLTAISRNTDTVKQHRRDDDLLNCGIRDDNGFTCNLHDTTLGTPTILISFGRSGSSATWQLMSAMIQQYI